MLRPAAVRCDTVLIVRVHVYTMHNIVIIITVIVSMLHFIITCKHGNVSAAGDLALDGLDRVHDDAHRAGVELLEALLRVHVRAREPDRLSKSLVMGNPWYKEIHYEGKSLIKGNSL